MITTIDRELLGHPRKNVLWLKREMTRKLTKFKCPRVLYVMSEGLGVGVIKIVLTTPPQLLRVKARPRLPYSSSP